MLLSAFLDMGLPTLKVHRAIRSLGIFPIKVKTLRIKKKGVWATRIENFGTDQFLRWESPRELLRLVRDSWPDRFLRRSVLRVVERLTHAEAQAHHDTPRNVVFHQLGRVDALVNIVSFCVGLDYFRIKEVYVSTIPVGFFHQDPHGVWRKHPGPATLRLLRRFSLDRREEPFEWVTPTAAALISTFASAQPAPALRILRVGCGVGRHPHPAGFDILHLLLGERI